MKGKVVNGLKWGLIDNLANQGITFLVGLVLARLLSPVEFGILGIITIFINLSITIIDGGLATALIRKPDSTDSDYNTVFYSNVGISLMLMLLVFGLAPTIATFFGQPLLGPTLRVMTLVLLINACSIIQKTLLVKKMDFRTQAFVSLVSSLGSGAIGIGMALSGYGVWSLVCQQLSRQTFLTLGLWLTSHWHPRLVFSREGFCDLFGFGSKLLLANVINSIWKDIFLAVIGKMYSTRDLGYYTRADQFNQIFSTNMGQVLQKISLPSLSELQNEAERLRASFRKMMRFTAMGNFAAVFGLAAMAEPVIVFILGQQWRPSVHLLQIISLYGAIYPLHQLNLNVLSVKKRSDRFLRLEIIKKCFFVPVILVGFFFRLEVMLWAAVVYYYFEFFLNGWYSKDLIGYGTLQQVRDLCPIYLISAGVSVVLWTLTLTGWTEWLVIVAQLAAACVLYPLVYRLSGIVEYVELRDFCLSKIRRR